MISIKRFWMFLLLLVVVIGSAPSVSRADNCPISVVGQWNGVWWHWCLVCPAGTTYVYASDTRMHGVGKNCGNIIDPLFRKVDDDKLKELRNSEGFKKLDDLEKIKKVAELGLTADRFTSEPPLRDLSPNLNAKQLKYIPLRKKSGDPGISDEPEDSFQLASSLFSVKEERTVYIKDKPGTTRYFRVLLIQATGKIDGKDVPDIGIGQELHPADGAAADPAATAAEHDDRFGSRQVILVTDKGDAKQKYWHVSCYKDFVKP